MASEMMQEINGKWLVTVNDLRTDIERYKAEEIKRFLGTSSSPFVRGDVWFI
jgi:hypothetical protein